MHDPIKVVPAEVLMDLAHGEGVDFAVEAAGATEKTIPEMEKTMAIGGKIAVVGRAAQRVPMYLERFQTRKAKLFGAQGYSGYGIFPVRHPHDGGWPCGQREDHSHRPLPLAKGLEALKKATKREDGKIVIMP